MNFLSCSLVSGLAVHKVELLCRAQFGLVVCLLGIRRSLFSEGTSGILFLFRHYSDLLFCLHFLESPL